MIRGMFTIASAVSLLLWVAACGLWARSYGECERVLRYGMKGIEGAWTARGSVEIFLLRADCSNQRQEYYGLKYNRDSPNGPFNGLLFVQVDYSTDTFWDWHGFAWYERRNTVTGEMYAEGVAPFWSIASVSGILPLAWAISFWRVRRWPAKPGLCRSCGYDLRASKDRCPECGGPVERQQTPATVS